MNGLMPQQGAAIGPAPPSGLGLPPGPGPMAGPGAPPGLDPAHADAIAQGHGAAKAAFSATSKASSQASAAKEVFAELQRMGDNVSPEDVVGAAGRLVGKGIDPVELAALLADMPAAGGPALSGWIDHQENLFQAKAQQIQTAHAVAGHHLALGALHSLMASTPPPGAEPPGQPSGSPSMPPTNVMMPGLSGGSPR